MCLCTGMTEEEELQFMIMEQERVRADSAVERVHAFNAFTPRVQTLSSRLAYEEVSHAQLTSVCANSLMVSLMGY